MTMQKLADGTELADFQYDFTLDAKAVESTVDENGDLWIEGYASDFGLDRQDEAFEPGAFDRGLKSFLQTNPIMLYHHKYDRALGQFTDARLDSNGLWVRGRVDKPAAGSWAEDVFNKIKKGTIRAFSVGGIFRRHNTKAGPRIYDVDLGEISVTPFPVNPRTSFAVVAQKAFSDERDPSSTKNDPDIGEEPGAIHPEARPALDDPAKEGESQKRAAEEGKGVEGECEACKIRAEQTTLEGENEEETALLNRELTADEVDAVGTALSQEGEGPTPPVEEEDPPPLNEQSEEAQLTALADALQRLINKMESPADPAAAPEVTPTPAADSLIASPEGKAAGTALPSLERSLKKNWVEKVGGFGVNNWIYRAAKHLVYEKGFPIPQAIAIAINAAKKMCATGDTNFPGKQNVNPASRAEACAAVAKWEAMKAKANATP